MICKKCGADFEGKFCPNCGTPADTVNTLTQSQSVINGVPVNMAAPPTNNEPFYTSTWFIVLMLACCCFPLGLILMWKYNKFNKPVRIVISSIFALAVLMTLITSGMSILYSSKNTYKNLKDDVTTSSYKETEAESVESSVYSESSPQETTTLETTTAPTPVDTKGLTIGQENALTTAKSYLSFTAFSYSGLIKQLEYEQFSTEDATFAADNCGADWNQQAALAAKQYLEFTSFSRGSLIDQLIYEGFTQSQAEYGATAAGY
jgi:hypothetical protein